MGILLNAIDMMQADLDAARAAVLGGRDREVAAHAENLTRMATLFFDAADAALPVPGDHRERDTSTTDFIAAYITKRMDDLAVEITRREEDSRRTRDETRAALVGTEEED